MCAAAITGTITIMATMITTIDHPHGIAEAALFDSFVIVDWSAASHAEDRPRQHLDLPPCDRDGAETLLENPPTRHAREDAARANCSRMRRRAASACCSGSIFRSAIPPASPRGSGSPAPPWRAVWDEIAALLEDDENNRNNRFDGRRRVQPARVRRRVSVLGLPGAASPTNFSARSTITATPRDGLAEKRLIDTWMVGAQPCWKLAYTGSVGSQALTGIPVVRALRDDPRWADRARIWPFETGLAAARCGADRVRRGLAVLVAAYRRRLGPPKDKAQVRTVAAHFRRADRTGELARWFAGDPDLTAEQRRIVETEEAWTLGVMRRAGSPLARRSDRRQLRKRKARDATRPPCSATGRSVCPKGREGRNHSCYDYLRDPGGDLRALVRADPRGGRSRPLSRSAAAAGAAAGACRGRCRDPRRSRLVARRRRRPDGARLPAARRSWSTARWSRPASSATGCRRDNRVDLHVARPRSRGRSRRQLRTTRSAAAVELWRPHLAGAVVAIGNAPTALFHLLEMHRRRAPTPGAGARLSGRVCRRRRSQGGADRVSARSRAMSRCAAGAAAARWPPPRSMRSPAGTGA